MARVVTNAQIPYLKGEQSQWGYNALDCAVTAEVWETLVPELTDLTDSVYTFDRLCQNWSMQMQLRGMRVDLPAREAAAELLVAEALGRREEVDKVFAAYGEEPVAWKKSFAPSPQRLKKLFYETMKLPPHYNRKGEISTDKECLKKLHKKYEKARPIVDLIMELRDGQKQHEVMTNRLRPDGRFGYTMSVGATETGRLSSTKDCFGNGGNAQNIDGRLRHVFIPDERKRMYNVDLSQAESLTIAYLAGDEDYIAAHKRGNVHVEAAWTFWSSGVDWTGDPIKDKKVAKMTPAWWIPQPKPEPGEAPAFSIYDMSKRGQHGLNYMLTPTGLAIWLGCTKKEATTYYESYFGKFSAIPQYHNRVKTALKETQMLVGPPIIGKHIAHLGRVRQFYDRPWELSTVREAVAHVPQSVVGDVMKAATYDIWYDLDPHVIEVLANGHDALLGQVWTSGAEAAAKQIEPYLNIDVHINGRVMNIPCEWQLGANWGEV